MGKGAILYPKRKEQRLGQVAGDEINSVINQITNTTVVESSPYATYTVRGIARFASTDFLVANGNVEILPASTTVTGNIEIATASETTTGTDDTRAVSPDGLAGSIFGTRVIGIIAVDATTDLSVADGKAYVPVPAALNGMNLTRAQAIVITAGTTNATTIDIYNVTDSQDMLSSAISIASGATVGTVGTINASYDDVATNDVLRVDVTTMSTTAPKGLLIVLEFRLP